MEITRGRETDAWIAEHVFGWGTMATPPDVNGENVSEILVPPAGIPAGLTFPPKGRIHRAFLVPQFTTRAIDALSFAAHVGLQEVPTLQAQNALAICRLAMAKHEARRTPTTDEGRGT